jgi:hypothetical protein
VIYSLNLKIKRRICFLSLASSRSSNKTSTPNKQNGNTRQSKPKKTVVSPVSNDSSYSPTTMDEKNNNLTTKRKIIKIDRRSSIDLNETNSTTKKKRPIGKNSLD